MVLSVSSPMFARAVNRFDITVSEASLAPVMVGFVVGVVPKKPTCPVTFRVSVTVPPVTLRPPALMVLPPAVMFRPLAMVTTPLDRLMVIGA